MTDRIQLVVATQCFGAQVPSDVGPSAFDGDVSSQFAAPARAANAA
jgi:hypothetical protein